MGIEIELTDQYKEFLLLNIIRGLPYPVVSRQMDVPTKTLSIWFEELKPEREKINKIKDKWNKKKFTPTFEEYYNWFISREKNCTYCGITEEQIKLLLDSGKINNKRSHKRGRTLEFDRKKPDMPYDDLDNIVLSCYWCNNAKTDTFTYEEFKETIGKAFAEVWKKRLDL